MALPNTLGNTKQGLRLAMLSRRQAQPAEHARVLAHRAQKALLEHACWNTARCVALYMPVRGEMDTGLVRADAWARGLIVLLPRCINRAGHMELIPCAGPQDLRQGAFGIMEPVPVHDTNANTPIPDILIMPGIAYDSRGYRLGFGKGYYDRLLADPALRSSLRVGLAFGWQIVPTLPTDTWDSPVHCLCTEDGLTWL